MRSQTIESFLDAKLRRAQSKGKTIPLDGSIELTYRCNLNCVHCYCKGLEDKRKELSLLKLKIILDEIYGQGCLRLCFTGGEPLIREDFLEIYEYARKKGFLITVFTNLTLLSEDAWSFFKKYPPFLVEVPIYGVNKETHESVTGVAGSFERTLNNVKRFSKAGIALILKTIGLTQNKDEVLGVKALSEELLGKKRFKFDSFVFPRLNGDTTPCKYRLSPKEILEIEGADRDMTRQRRHERSHNAYNLKAAGEFLYHCDSWRSNFFLNPYGRIGFCGLSGKYSLDFSPDNFKRGFYFDFPDLRNEKFITGSPCKECDLREYCYFCPARSYLETGNHEGPVAYYCELAKSYSMQAEKLKGGR